MLLAVAAAATATAALPNFTFRDAVAGALTTPRQFGPCDEPDANNEQICMDNDTQVAGEHADVAVRLFEGRFSGVIGKFGTNSYPVIARAFSAKYGEPCDGGEKDWQPAEGPRTRRATKSTYLVWCFRSGKLFLDQIGPTRETGSFAYIDDWRARPGAPKIDF